MKFRCIFKNKSSSLKKSVLASFMAISALFASSAAQADGELEHVTLTVLVNPLGAPQAFLKDDFQRPYGIDVDVIYELQRRLGFKLAENRIFVLDRPSSQKRLREGSADLFAGGVSRTTERMKTFDFTPVYYASSMGLMFNPKIHPNIKSVSDIKGLRIGASSGSTSAKYVEMLGATPVPFTNAIQAYFHVFTGDLDGVLFDRPPLAGFAHDMKWDEFAVTPEAALGRESCKYAIMMPKGSKYKDVISNEISEMISDGTIDKILLKWHSAEMSVFNSENY